MMTKSLPPHQRRRRTLPPLLAATLATTLLAGLAPGVARADDYAKAKALLEKGDLRGAQIELRNAVRDDPENGPAHLSLAEVDIRLGDAAGAEKEARRARDLGTDPKRATDLLLQSYLDQQRPRDLLQDFPATGNPPEIQPVILVGRARAELGLGHLDKAREAIDAARALAPNSPDVALAAADIATADNHRDTAQQIIDAALKTNPDNSPLIRRKAQMLLGQGDRAGALALLDGLISQQPHDLLALLARADILVATGQGAKAKADLDTVQKELPGSAQALYLRALLAVQEGDFKTAGADMEKLSSVLTRMPNAYYLDALVKNRLGEQEQALDSAARYVARFPADRRGVALLAQIQLARHDLPGALATLQKAVAANDKDPVLQEMLGQTYLAAGQIPQAITAYEAASKLVPNNAALLTRLGELQLDAGDNTAAAATFEHSLKLDPKQDKAGEMLVMTGIVSGNFNQAQQNLDTLRKQEGDAAITGNLEGLLKIAELDLPGARAAFEGVLKAHPDSVPAKLSLARLALLEGRNDEAEKLLSGILDTQPANPTALTMLVSALEQTGEAKQAVAVLERAHAAAPANTTLTASFAALMLQSGDAAKALALTMTAPGEPAPPTLLMVRAAAQINLGRVDEATETYRAVLAADPSQTAARINIARLLASKKDFAGAKEVLEAGLKAYPANYDLMQADLGTTLVADGMDAALAKAAALAANPVHLPLARALTGDLYLSQKRFDEAAKAYAAALAEQPMPLLALREATALTASGKPDAAMGVLRDWLGQHPDDSAVALALSGMEINAHQYDQASKRLQEVLARQPNNTIALNNLAWIEQQQKNPDALKLAERAYLLAPGAQTADTLGYILTTSGKPAGLNLLRQAHAELPNDPSIQYHLAVALNTAGQKDDAVKLLTPLLGEKVAFAEKDAARQLLDQIGPGK
jgi:putative PEP-CTERM system TPR-repeat lipoprotein